MRGGLERRQPEALQAGRRHHGERAGVQRGQLGVVDAPRAVADDDQLGVESARPRADVRGGEDAERLARLVGADEQEVAAAGAGAARQAP